MKTIKFTKRALSDVPVESKAVKVEHPRIRGFYAYLQRTTRTYYLYKRQKGGKPVRIKIGNVLTLPVADAERLAIEYTNQLDQGINPNEERKKAKEAAQKVLEDTKTFPLSYCYDLYMKNGNLKPGTLNTYRSQYSNHLSRWADIDIRDIDPTMCEQLYSAAEKKEVIYKAIIFLGSMYDYVALRNERHFKTTWDLNRKTFKKLIYEKRRSNATKKQAVIPTDRLGFYFATCEAMAFNSQNIATRGQWAAMLLSLLTGLRFGESSKIMWSNVCFDTKVITLPDTKITGRVHKVYMCIYTETFLRRWNDSMPESAYVFSQRWNLSKPIPRRHDLYVDIAKYLRLENFGTHANRRSFACLAEELGIPEHRIQNMLNHKVRGNVTRASYLKLMKFNPRKVGEDFNRVGNHLYRMAERFRKTPLELSDVQVRFFEEELGSDWKTLLIESNLKVVLPPPELGELEASMNALLDLLGGADKSILDEVDEALINELREYLPARRKITALAG